MCVIVTFLRGARWRVCLLFVLLTTGFPCLKAQEQTDSLEVSLLTCSPGDQVWSLYGHTALRVRETSSDADIVFNYGIFSFNTPHFIWRFTLGECDYMVTAEPFADFARGYERRGSYILEQRLNLKQQEAQRLLYALLVNVQPGNCTYRYNYLTDNCTTKVRDAVANCIEGNVIISSPFDEPFTYRQAMHIYSAGHPWAELGNDILLGANCDTLVNDEAAMFLPFTLAMYFDSALIEDSSGEVRPMVVDVGIAAGTFRQQTEEPYSGLTPRGVAIAFLCLCVLVAIIEFCTRRMWWGFDAVLMTAVGLSGCLLCFVFCFSLHPTLNSNWQIWVLNPLPLLCMPWVVARAVKHRRCAYHYLSAAFLTIFIVLSPWIPQVFCEIIVPLALSLLTRNVSYCIYYRRK